MESSCRNLRALNAYIQLLLDAASQRDDPMICLELMEIYRLLNRPVSAYGYLLRAKRLGAAINPGVSAEMQTSLKQVIFTLHPRILTEHILWVASLHITPNILNLRYIIYSNPLKTGIHTDSPP